MSESLILFARIAPKPEHFDAARRAVSKILPATRAEPGCRAFILHEDDRDGSGCLYLYEVGDSETALAAHYAQPYTQAVFEQYRAWLAEPVAITRMRRIDGAGACSS